MRTGGPLHVGLRVVPPLLSDVLVTLLRRPGVTLTLLDESRVGETNPSSASVVPDVALVTRGLPTPFDVELILVLPDEPGAVRDGGSAESTADGRLVAVDDVAQVLGVIEELVSGQKRPG